MERISSLPRSTKKLIAILLDLGVGIVAVFCAYYLRLDRWAFPVSTEWLSLAAAPLLAFIIFFWLGIYRVIFRHSGLGTMVNLATACLGFAIAYALIFTAIGIPGVPRSIGLLQPILLFLGVVAWRLFARALMERRSEDLGKQRAKRRSLIYGAGAAGRQLAAALAASRWADMVGYVDDDPALVGHALNGKRIYAPEELMDLITDLRIDDLLIALPSATRSRRAQILELASKTGANVRLLPGVDEVALGHIRVNDLREPDIEDILGRDPVPPDPELLASRIAGKRVMVSGAGGSIGAELCRQILAQHPHEIVLFEMSEYSLYSILSELTNLRVKLGFGEVILTPVLASIQSPSVVDATMARCKPETVFHAAAYKHVPLVEANMVEAVKNNIFGTKLLAEAAQRHGVERFVLISTDKAVRPTNVMGATKRVAEQTLQSLTAKGEGSTVFSMVRFGNVLGSSGSVVPLFRAQIKAGGPITVTHRDVTRYFMTIPEASQLVIQAGAMAQGGEVFLLDMGEPVKIVDLARRMIELSGLEPCSAENLDGDIEIEFVGLRPGEKLYEELLIGSGAAKTSHPSIMMANETFMPTEELDKMLAQLAERISAGSDTGEIMEIMELLVPDFDHRPLH